MTYVEVDMLPLLIDVFLSERQSEFQQDQWGSDDILTQLEYDELEDAPVVEHTHEEWEEEDQRQYLNHGVAQ